MTHTAQFPGPVSSYKLCPLSHPFYCTGPQAHTVFSGEVVLWNSALWEWHGWFCHIGINNCDGLLESLIRLCPVTPYPKWEVAPGWSSRCLRLMPPQGDKCQWLTVAWKKHFDDSTVFKLVVLLSNHSWTHCFCTVGLGGIVSRACHWYPLWDE